MYLERLRTFSRSWRFRVMLWNAGAVLLTGAAVLMGLREGVRRALINELDQVLQSDLNEVELHFQGQRALDLEALQRELTLKAQGHQLQSWFVQFLDTDRERMWSSHASPELKTLSQAGLPGIPLTVGSWRFIYAGVETLRSGTPSYVCVGSSLTLLDADMARIDRLVAIAAGIVLLAAPLGGYLLAGRAIEPIAELSRTAQRLHPQKMEERLPVRGANDEVDQLASEFNDLLDRVAIYLRERQDYLANAAHELRTPLAAIRSSVEVALGTDRSAEQYRELLADVIEETSSLEGLVNQLLLLAEADAEKLQMHTEPVALSRVVTLACEMFRAVAEERGVELTYNVVPGVVVDGNRQHLRQVLTNLLDNAIKFTGCREDDPPTANGEAQTHRPKTMHAELQVDAAARQAVLKIEDTGIGVSAADLTHLFERFYRADRSRQRTTAKGTGLGLSICQAVVQAHHGSISAQSQLGQGTTFTVRLPLAEAPLETPQAALAADRS